jgi:hypothetical protein
MNTWQDEVHFDVLKLDKEELERMKLVVEQLQENLMTFLDGMSDEVLDGVCQVVVDTFKEVGV